MFWNRKKEQKAEEKNNGKEIDKVIKQYGLEKGTAILTYYYTFIMSLRKRDEFARFGAEVVNLLYAAIEKEHGEGLLSEYKRFFQSNHSNKALIDELDCTGDVYFDRKLVRGKVTAKGDLSNQSPDDLIQIDNLNAYFKIVDLLDSEAKEIMKKAGLSKQDEIIPALSEIYYPDSFSTSIMRYCQNEYEQDGEQVIKGEYVSTAYYASICATVLYKKRVPHFEERIRGDYPLSAITNYVDLEYANLSAQELLGAKKDHQLADMIWHIILPYLGLCHNVFNKVSRLDESIVLAAIKNAYTIGMLVGDKYTSGQYISNLDLFTEKDVYKICSPYEINEDTNGKAVRITGLIQRSENNYYINISTPRGGDAEIKVVPIDLSEQSVIDKVLEASETDYRTISLYGILVEKGRWDSELQCAFVGFTPQRARQLQGHLR